MDGTFSINITNLSCQHEIYGIIMAAGNGKRMIEFIKQNYGTDYPKQFVAFTGKQSMIQHTLKRAEKLIIGKNLLIVVDPRHQAAIDAQLRNRPEGTIIYQPANRETAPGVLLPLSYIYKNNPDSTVAILPSDHFILNETRFMDHLRFATSAIQVLPEKVILLGIQPDEPEEEYGWIQPGKKVFGRNQMEIFQVETFHEKPDPVSAQIFYQKGYLWNTLVMVARCRTLWELTKEALPRIHNRFQKILDAIGTPKAKQVIQQEYDDMDPASISHEVLAKYPSRLAVIKIKDVLWDDWGNGKRVRKTLNKIGLNLQSQAIESMNHKMALT